MNKENFDLTVKFCENLPFNLTILEEDGLCQKQKANCRYNKYSGLDLQICHKKTFTPTSDLPLTRRVI